MIRSVLAAPIFALVGLTSLVALSAGCVASASEAEKTESSEEALTSLAQPVKVASFNGDGPLFASATHLYFHDDSLQLVRRVAKSGGAVETVLTPDGWVTDLTLDATHVYAVVDKSATPGAGWGFGAIVRASLAGGNVETLLGGEVAHARIAVDGTHVYVATGGKLSRFPKSGAFVAPEPLGDATNVSALATDSTNVYWADMGPGNPAIGCNRGDGRIMARPKTGGVTRVIANAEDCPQSVAVDGSTLYFRSFFGPIRKVSTFTGLASTVAATSNTVPALDQQSLYFAVGVDRNTTQLRGVGKLVAFPRDFAKTRAALPAAITSVSADATYAYYVVHDFTTGAGDIYRLAK